MAEENSAPQRNATPKAKTVALSSKKTAPPDKKEEEREKAKDLVDVVAVQTCDSTLDEVTFERAKKTFSKKRKCKF